MDFPFFQPVGERSQLGHLFTFYFLAHPRVQELVASVRGREGIDEPSDEEDLAANLEAYVPEQFEAEAFEVVRVVWREWVDLVNARLLSNLADDERELILATVERAREEPATALGEKLMEFAQPEGQARKMARIVAEFIVCGLLRIPKPVMPYAYDGVRVVESGGDTIVTAVATAATDLDELIQEFRRKCHEVFGDRRRTRQPEIGEKFWFYLARKIYEAEDQEEMDRGMVVEGDTKVRMDRRLAELSFCISPERRPKCSELSNEYEEALEKEAGRIRWMLSSLPKDLERMIPGISPLP